MPYSHSLADDEKAELLRIARATLKEHLLTGRTPPGAPHRQCLRDPASVFVSLRVAGDLRGCIGNITEEKPLYLAVQDMVIAAASRDPRFRALGIDDLADLTIEISVLGNAAPVTGPGDIDIGTHGLVVTRGFRRGLLLPQVASGAGWDAETFLGRTCEKAGLEPDTWRSPDTEMQRFEAQVFDENAYPPPSAWTPPAGTSTSRTV